MNIKGNNEMKKVVIFGTGDMAQVAHYYLTYDSDDKVVAFTVDRDYMKEKQLFSLPVVPFEEVERHYPSDEFAMFIAVAYSQVNKVRAQKYYGARKKGYELISYVSPKSVVSGNVEVGDNCFIFENQTIQPFVKIGNDVIIWSGNHIGHHSVIGDHCFIASHVVISGNVTVEPYCFLGVNSTIRNGITIARECVIGAGALILKDTQEKGVYTAKAAELHPLDSSRLKHI